MMNRKIMAQAYSYDLRIRVMEFIESGKRIKQAAELFSISRKTIMRWRDRKKETGDFKEKVGYQKLKARGIIKNTEEFQRFIESNNDKTLKELAEIWPQKVSYGTIYRMLQKLKISYKKNIFPPQKRSGTQE